ncbi:23170_t:CDS:10 [Rhizophagus irregularis]|nr:23170_t:CDS:10 [Rhizophagus irregularis]
MVIFSRTLFFLITIFTLSIIVTFAQEPIEYTESLPGFRFGGSDTYKDGTIILLFTQGNNQTKFLDTKIHLRIIFVNRTILPVEINYNSLPDFIPQCNSINPLLCATTLTPKALIERYVLIESSQNGSPHKQIIISWDGIIYGVYDIKNKYQVTTDLDSKQEFFISELQNATTLIWRRFIVQNQNELKEENGTYNVFKDNTFIYLQNTFSLIEGGYANIIFTQTAGPNNNTIHEVYVIYFKNNNNFASYKQYLLYSSISGKILNLSGDCKNSFDGSGYTFFFTDIDGSKPDVINSQNYNYFRIHFLSNGEVSFIDTNYFDVRNTTVLDYSATEIIPLFYGGYLGFNRLNPNNKLIITYDDNINIKQTLNLTYNFNKNGLSSFIMQKQSLLWFFNYDNIQTWNINFYPLNSIEITDSRYTYQNPAISGTYPKIDGNVQILNQINQIRKPFDFIINYNRPIIPSSENIIIYQYLNDNNVILRQKIPGQSDLCQLINDTTISVKIFVSTLHQLNVKYGVKVENNFVKTQFDDEPLLGISETIWTFNTSLEAPEKSADQVTIAARLNFDNENINLYNEINSKDSPLFQQLKDELVQAIPIDSKRLKISKKIQKIQNKITNSVLISITIMPPATNDGTERNTDSVLNDLNELIQQKKYNLISSGDITKFFDENYGVQTIPDFWEKYLITLIIISVAILFLFLLVFIARKKYPEGKNFAIIKIILIINDLVLDIAFVAKNANDVPNLFIFSLLSVIIPILFNMIMATYSLVQEIIYNKDFNAWSKENNLIVSIFTILSSLLSK